MGHRAVRHHHRLAGRSAPLARSAGRDLRRSVFLPDHVAVFLARAVGDQHDDPSVIILGLGYRHILRSPRQRVLRCARSVALVGTTGSSSPCCSIRRWVSFAWTGWNCTTPPSFWMDVRYYIGWAIGLALARRPIARPNPSLRQRRLCHLHTLNAGITSRANHSSFPAPLTAAADREADGDAIQPGIALLQFLQRLDDIGRGGGEEPPAFTASSMRGSFAVGARFGSRMVSICSSVRAFTRRSSPNIFMFSS